MRWYWVIKLNLLGNRNVLMTNKRQQIYFVQSIEKNYDSCYTYFTLVLSSILRLESHKCRISRKIDDSYYNLSFTIENANRGECRRLLERKFILWILRIKRNLIDAFFRIIKVLLNSYKVMYSTCILVNLNQNQYLTEKPVWVILQSHLNYCSLNQ